MVRLFLMFGLIMGATVVLYVVILLSSRSKHRSWVPGSKPLAKPPAGKEWRYDIYKEEWRLEDE